MSRLSPEQLKNRFAFDFAVVERMSGGLWVAEAYRSIEDLRKREHPIANPADAGSASKYRVTFNVPTLVGPGNLTDSTVIGADLFVGNYPYAEPNTWVMSKIPYSPHFKEGAPVCLGEIWSEARGRMLLGQLFNHLARLLNWDEVARGGGYRGWNGAAIDYHRRIYGEKPLNPGIVYPSVPLDLTHGISVLDEALFSLEHNNPRDLFVAAATKIAPPSRFFEPA